MINQNILTYYWVVRLKSFKKAGLKLNTTQPAVSSRIAKLEEIIGQRLIIRGRGTLTLTSAGQTLLDFSEAQIAMAEETRNQISSNETVTSKITIGVIETVASSWLDIYLHRIGVIYPNLDLELVVDNTDTLRDRIVNGSIDIAILMGPISHHRVVNTQLNSMAMCFFSNKAMSRDVASTSLVQVAQQIPIWTFPQDSRPFAEIKNQLKRNGALRCRLFPSNSIQTAIRLVASGAGIGCLPVNVKQLTEHDLVELEFEWVPNAIELTVSFNIEPWNSVISELADLAKSVSFGEFDNSHAV